MKQGLFLLLIGLTSSVTIHAEDSGNAQTQTQGDQGQGSATPDSTSTPKYGKKGYGSEGYGGRADVFADGFWLFTTNSNGNAIHQQATQVGGFAAGYRFRLNSWSALEGRYGFASNSQKYGIGGTTTSIPSYLAEVTGSYVYNFHQFHRVQPFLEGGGGILHLRPGNYGAASTSSNGGGGSASAPPVTGGTGGSGGVGTGPYMLAIPAQAPAALAASTGNVISLPSQTRPAFTYGAGIDLPAFSHFYIRLEYRGLGYKTPDFGQPGLNTNTFSFISEPSIGISYRF